MGNEFIGTKLDPVSPLDVAAILSKLYIFGDNKSWSYSFPFTTLKAREEGIEMDPERGYGSDSNLMGKELTDNWDLVIRIMLLSNLIGLDWSYSNSPTEQLFPNFRENMKTYKLRENIYKEAKGYPLQFMFKFLQVQFSICHQPS